MNLIIYFLIINNSFIYQINAKSQKYIYKFSRINLIFLIKTIFFNSLTKEMYIAKINIFINVFYNLIDINQFTFIIKIKKSQLN